MNFHKFDHFFYNTIKITPSIASDWRFILSSKPGFISVSSEQLDQNFLIPEISFFSDLNQKSISLTSDHYLIGSFIFSKNKNIYSESEYMDWLNERSLLKANSIRKRDLVPGKSYILQNHSLVFFLGTKYISTFKGSFDRYSKKKDLDPSLFTPISKRYIFSNSDSETFEIHTKIILNLGNDSISPHKRKRLLHNHQMNNPFIAYYRDDCPPIRSFSWDYLLDSFSSSV